MCSIQRDLATDGGDLTITAGGNNGGGAWIVHRDRGGDQGLDTSGCPTPAPGDEDTPKTPVKRNQHPLHNGRLIFSHGQIHGQGKKPHRIPAKCVNIRLKFYQAFILNDFYYACMGDPSLGGGGPYSHGTSSSPMLPLRCLGSLEDTCELLG